MKKVLRYLLMTVLAICFTVPCLNAAEAATVALLPLINNVAGDELANQVYYKNAIEANKVEGSVPSEAALAKIAKDGDVDIVFAIQLDKLGKKPMNRVGERMIKLEMEGKAVAYNRLSGVYYSHNLRGGKEIDETLTSRWDWPHEEFGRAVRQEISRAMRAK